MRALIQRVSSSSVTVDGKITGAIGRGLGILLGITEDDTEEDVDYLADKCVNLRIFSDNDGKFNLSARDVGAEILVVSQFTLYADCRKGRRPSFVAAARAEVSEPLYETFVAACRRSGLQVETGIFGASMRVEIVNDGPVTILLESEFKRKPRADSQTGAH